MGEYHMDITTMKGKANIYVKLHASENKVLGFDAERGAFVIALHAEAIENKANKALIQFLKKLTKKQVRIVAGLKSREKVVEFF